MLHEAVGDDDPQGGDVAGKEDEPGAEAVQLLAYLLPAEVPDGDEGGLEEEGHRGFNGEERAEDVADELGVARPVGAELEFERNAGHDAEREVDEKELAPELGVFQPDFVAGLHVPRLHPGDHERQAEGEGDEDEVEEDGHGELQSGKHCCIHWVLPCGKCRCLPGPRALGQAPRPAGKAFPASGAPRSRAIRNALPVQGPFAERSRPMHARFLAVFCAAKPCPLRGRAYVLFQTAVRRREGLLPARRHPNPKHQAAPRPGLGGRHMEKP